MARSTFDSTVVLIVAADMPGIQIVPDPSQSSTDHRIQRR
jgi:hypothetical protein